ncbi:Mss4-like protein [Fusarium avenaceum]|nr:Mss4-like protein [Fusarium avenaceum]
MASFDDNGFPVVHLSHDGWSTDDETTATCFCGAVQLVLPLKKPGLLNRHVCHCTDCRKIGSAFYQSNITVDDSYLKHTRGEDNLATFSEEKTIRANATMTNYFCKTCGTLMYRRGARFPGLTIMRTGTVDDLSLAETKLRPQVEQFIERRAAWSKPIEGAAQVVGMHSPEDIEGIP